MHEQVVELEPALGPPYLGIGQGGLPHPVGQRPHRGVEDLGPQARGPVQQCLAGRADFGDRDRKSCSRANTPSGCAPRSPTIANTSPMSANAKPMSANAWPMSAKAPPQGANANVSDASTTASNANALNTSATKPRSNANARPPKRNRGLHGS